MKNKKVKVLALTISCLMASILSGWAYIDTDCSAEKTKDVCSGGCTHDAGDHDVLGSCNWYTQTTPNYCYCQWM